MGCYVPIAIIAAMEANRGQAGGRYFVSYGHKDYRAPAELAPSMAYNGHQVNTAVAKSMAPGITAIQAVAPPTIIA